MYLTAKVPGGARYRRRPVSIMRLLVHSLPLFVPLMLTLSLKLLEPFGRVTPLFIATNQVLLIRYPATLQNENILKIANQSSDF